MKLKVLLLILALVTMSPLFAQTNKGYFSLGITAGPSFPLANFSNKEVVNDPYIINTNGIAKTGLVVNLLPGYSLNKKIHFYLQAGAGLYKQDQQALHAHVKRTLGTNNQVDVEEGSWKIFKFLGGFSYAFLIGENSRFRLQPKLAVGICATSYPGYKVTWYDENGNVDLVATLEDNKLPLTFCVETGLAAGYELGKHLDLLLSVDYFNSTPKESYSYYPYFPYQGNEQTAVKRFNLSSLAIGTGISYKF